MVQGCAHPLGPLALYKEPLHSPPPLLARMVQAALLGRKSGRGFHEYVTVGGEREKNSC